MPKTMTAAGFPRRGDDARGDWRRLLVFVSSTFTDMQAERDVLRDVFAELDERLRQGGYRTYLVPIDLRWGVDTVSALSEVEKEMHVLKVCLEEIRRSRPFFVGLLGDRYGWVPAPERMRRAVRDAGLDIEVAGRSITALEIEYGVFASTDQRRRSLFYLREPLPYDDMPAEAARRFVDGAAASGHHALAELKARLRRELPSKVHSYQLGWDPATQAPTDLDGFAALVRDTLWSEIEAQVLDDHAAHRGQPLDDVEVELDAFFAQRLRTFVGRRQLVEELARRAMAPEPPDRATSPWWWIPRRTRPRQPVTILQGAPGLGKSSVMAALHRRLHGEDVVLLMHGAGAGARSASLDRALRRWCSLLDQTADQENTPGEDATYQALADRFAATLERAAASRRVVLLVDAIDQFEDTDAARRLTWLPERLPANVRVVLSTSLPQQASLIAGRFGTEPTVLAPLRAAETIELLQAVAALHRRELHPEVQETLLERGSAMPTPLWSLLALDQLLLLDADDFDRSADLPGSPDEQLHALLLHTVEALPPAVPDLYRCRFETAESAHGRAHVSTYLGLLATSRSGLRDRDLSDLVSSLTGVVLGDLVQARIRRSLRAALTERADGRLDFAHAQARLAARHRYLDAAERERQLHAAIALHLASLPQDDSLRAEELPHHLLALDDGQGLARHLGSDLDAREARAAVRALTAESEQQQRMPTAFTDALAQLSGPDLARCARFVLDRLSPALQGRVDPAVRRVLIERVRAAVRRSDANDDPRLFAAHIDACRQEAALALATGELNEANRIVANLIEIVGELSADATPEHVIRSARLLLDRSLVDREAGNLADASRWAASARHLLLTTLNRQPTTAVAHTLVEAHLRSAELAQLQGRDAETLHHLDRLHDLTDGEWTQVVTVRQQASIALLQARLLAVAGQHDDACNVLRAAAADAVRARRDEAHESARVRVEVDAALADALLVHGECVEAGDVLDAATADWRTTTAGATAAVRDDDDHVAELALLRATAELAVVTDRDGPLLEVVSKRVPVDAVSDLSAPRPRDHRGRAVRIAAARVDAELAEGVGARINGARQTALGVVRSVLGAFLWPVLLAAAVIAVSLGAGALYAGMTWLDQSETFDGVARLVQAEDYARRVDARQGTASLPGVAALLLAGVNYGAWLVAEQRLVHRTQAWLPGAITAQVFLAGPVALLVGALVATVGIHAVRRGLGSLGATIPGVEAGTFILQPAGVVLPGLFAVLLAALITLAMRERARFAVTRGPRLRGTAGFPPGKANGDDPEAGARQVANGDSELQRIAAGRLDPEERPTPLLPHERAAACASALRRAHLAARFDDEQAARNRALSLCHVIGDHAPPGPRRLPPDARTTAELVRAQALLVRLRTGRHRAVDRRLKAKVGERPTPLDRDAIDAALRRLEEGHPVPAAEGAADVATLAGLCTDRALEILGAVGGTTHAVITVAEAGLAELTARVVTYDRLRVLLQAGARVSQLADELMDHLRVQEAVARLELALGSLLWEEGLVWLSPIWRHRGRRRVRRARRRGCFVELTTLALYRPWSARRQVAGIQAWELAKRPTLRNPLRFLRWSVGHSLRSGGGVVAAGVAGPLRRGVRWGRVLLGPLAVVVVLTAVAVGGSIRTELSGPVVAGVRWGAVGIVAVATLCWFTPARRWGYRRRFEHLARKDLQSSAQAAQLDLEVEPSDEPTTAVHLASLLGASQQDWQHAAAVFTPLRVRGLETEFAQQIVDRLAAVGVSARTQPSSRPYPTSVAS